MYRGNDAQRGGRNGDWVEVKFTEEFYLEWALALAEIDNRRKHRAYIDATKEAEKKASQAIADTIKLDDQFTAEINRINEACYLGEERAKCMAGAFKALLVRNGFEDFVANFWQVFRIVKKNAGL